MNAPVSPYLNIPLRSEVEARRDRLAADLRAEGANEAAIARLATDEVAGRMVKYESEVIGLISGMFGGPK